MQVEFTPSTVQEQYNKKEVCPKGQTKVTSEPAG